MNPMTLLNLLIFFVLLCLLVRLNRHESSLSRRVLISLVIGSLFGFYLQVVFGFQSEVVQQTMAWTNVVANSYVNLLKLIIMPLVLITMIASVLKVDEIKTLGSIGGSVIAVLLLTTMIAALIGILMAILFGLTAEGLASGAAELAKAEDGY